MPEKIASLKSQGHRSDVNQDFSTTLSGLVQQGGGISRFFAPKVRTSVRKGNDLLQHQYDGSVLHEVMQHVGASICYYLEMVGYLSQATDQALI